MKLTFPLRFLLEDSKDEEVVSTEKLKRGVNSEVYKVQTTKGNKYLVKQYIKRARDKRHRLATEFSSLSFLWRNGLRIVPKPITKYPENDIGIYKYIEGTRLTKSHIRISHVEKAAAFLKQLYLLSKRKDATNLPNVLHLKSIWVLLIIGYVFFFVHQAEACFTTTFTITLRMNSFLTI